MPIDNQKKIEIKFEIPELANATLMPLADRIGVTLSSLWTGVFGGVEYWAQRKQFERQANLEKFKILVEQNISNIDTSNLQYPRISIIGSAIDSSKYYFEESHYREMFANLIAASMDKSENQIIHTSFSQTITQLDPNDARILKLIFDTPNKAIPSVTIRAVACNSNSSSYENILETIIDENATNIECNSNLISIQNLQRLNLIRLLPSVSFANKSVYDKFQSGFLYHSIQQAYIDNTEVKANLNFEKIDLTSYGTNFCSICLK